MTIFYVDDDLDEIELFCEAINRIDPAIRCITHTNSEHALMVLDEITAPDFIFLDLNMPRKNGVDCLRQIRKTKKLKDVPVIIYSSAADSKDVQELNKMGATLFLSKHHDIVNLCKQLQAILKPSVIL